MPTEASTNTPLQPRGFWARLVAGATVVLAGLGALAAATGHLSTIVEFFLPLRDVTVRDARTISAWYPVDKRPAARQAAPQIDTLATVSAEAFVEKKGWGSVENCKGEIWLANGDRIYSQAVFS